jgi:hypothetical protein
MRPDQVDLSRHVSGVCPSLTFFSRGLRPLIGYRCRAAANPAPGSSSCDSWGMERFLTAGGEEAED